MSSFAEGIDDESFLLLDNETITKIFPKAGPRLIFIRKYEAFRESIKTPVMVLCSSPIYSSSSDTVTIVSDVTSDSIEIVEDSSSCESKNIPTFLNSNEYNPDEPSSSSKQNCYDFTSLFKEDLKSILEKTLDGRIVLLKKDTSLNNDARQRLVKEIINYLIEKLGIDGIKTNVLHYAAEQITKLFPNEVKETYFIPYVKTKVVKRAARGKLWSRFVNVRNALRSAEGNRVKKIKLNCSSEVILEKAEELETLKTIIEPREKVLGLWVDTYKQRKHLLKISLSVQEIFDKYAALSTTLGPDLIDSDFSVKFEGKSDIIYTVITKLSNTVLLEASARKVTVVTDDVIDSVLKAVLILPYLFPPLTIKNKRKSGGWRPSRSEVGESFFMHCENFEELEEKKQQRQERLKAWNLTLQPFGVIVGPLTNVASYLVCINDTIYTFDSLIRAIDVLFKSFHVLDIEYPYECQHLWQFIERMVYDIKSSLPIPSVSSLISDLKEFNK